MCTAARRRRNYDMRLKSEDQMFGSVKPVSGLINLHD